ncbi:unnamed protein product [Chironomus riparius]|uniref:Peptidase S1 domain-containing protein n=1 Tax=Chironomus riparius TaxID=315576 RepID=A0A9P0JBI9_9DIPT|nr:unnamed protein product [Chironomus riparius]
MDHKSFLIFILTTTTYKSSVLAGTAFCTFEHTSKYQSYLISDEITGYMCKLDLDIKGDRVNDVGGYHEGGEHDNQVDIIKVLPDFYSYLTSFPETFCKRFKKLEIIDMSSTEIATIEDNSLSLCKDLRILQFYMNKIEIIPEKLLAENTKLLRLYITFNSIKTLPENLLNGLKELKILDLSYNKIDNLPENILRGLADLKDLNLEGNQIEDLGENLFDSLENLETLNLNSNEIFDLPAGIFNDLKSLKQFYIQQNKLTIIHADSFPQNIQLDIVSFSKNQIEAIDELFIERCGVSSIKMGGNICDRSNLIKNRDIKKRLNACFEGYRNKMELNAAEERELVTQPTTTTTYKPKMTTPRPTTSRTTTRSTTRKTTESTTKRTLPRITTAEPKTNNQQLVPWIQPCGISKAPVQNIILGTTVIKGTHPWIAVLVDKNGNYFCGGTLISKRLVVTAAHCVFGKNSVEKTPGDFVVLLGAHQLDNENEVGRKTHLVSNIRVDRNWNPNSKKFDADIAVLELNEEAKFGTWIQPVCLPKISAPLKNFKFGEVVGFGKTEKEGTHSNFPMKANTPIRKSDDCYNEYPTLLNIASHKTFCGGFANGTGACTGDSGGGLTVVQDDVHYLRGIVSASLHGTDYECNVESYSIFTDIRYYFNFIKNV